MVPVAHRGSRFAFLATLALFVATSTTMASAAAPKKVVVTGTLDVLQEDDFASGRTKRIYRLIEDGTGRVLVLQLKHRPAGDPLTGARLRVRGDESAGTLIVDDDAQALAVLAEDAPAAQLRRAVVMIVDFSGDSTGSGAGAVSCSTTQVADLMYTRAIGSGGNVAANYEASSYNQFSWQADSDGSAGPDVFRVSIQASIAESCSTSYSTWASKADTAATNAGVNLSLYQHRVYVVPNSTNCGWAGLANVGCGSSCRAWIKGSSCNTLDVYSHELGHNVGMGHASTDADNNGGVDSTCPFWNTSYGGGEYCDRSDFMGIGGDGKRQNNGPHKQQMGWVPAAKSADATQGTYALAPLGTDPSLTGSLQLLRVARSGTTPYLVSYRTNADAYEDNLRVDYQQKTSVHSHPGGSSNTLLITQLADGQSFFDAARGITITQVSHTATTATVQVSLNCTPSAPTVGLTPSSLAGRAGDAVTYTALVTNRDSAACASSTFQLAVAVPDGWSATLGSTTMPLGPGQQGSSSVTVTSAPAAADGSYLVTATATDTTGPELSGSGSGSATYCVDSTGPDPITDLSAAIKQKTKVQLQWSVPSSSSCAAVSAYDVYRDGARIATTANTSYLDGMTTRGSTYRYTVVARDVLGNASAASNEVTVTVGSGTSEKCTNGADDDGDGLIDCADSDCRRNRACR